MTRRSLVVTELLPRRNTPAERIAMMETDVREATAKARRRIEDYASRYTVSGWELDEESWEMTIPEGTRTLIVRGSLTRPADA